MQQEGAVHKGAEHLHSCKPRDFSPAVRAACSLQPSVQAAGEPQCCGGQRAELITEASAWLKATVRRESDEDTDWTFVPVLLAAAEL